jgi:hypothetical protein
MSMSAMEERIDALFPLPPIKGGAAAALSWEAMLALHRASVVTQRATSNLRACGRELCAEARRLRRIAARTIARTRALRAPISALRVATAMSDRRPPAGARLAVDTLPARR